MNDSLISLKTAKLAKEKNLNLECVFYYKNSKLKEHPNRLLYNWNQDNPPINQYSAPTQSLLQKWLREMHTIEVFVNRLSPETILHSKLKKKESPYHKTYHVFVGKLIEDKWDQTKLKTLGGDTYEQALELGLLNALNLIKL